MDRGGAKKDLLLAEELLMTNDCWGNGDSVFFRDVTNGKLTVLQWPLLFPHTYLETALIGLGESQEHK